MKGFLLFLALVWMMSSCQSDQAGHATIDLESIRTVQELKQAEEILDKGASLDPDQDRTGEYVRLAGKAVTLSRLLDAERLYQKALWGDLESPDRADALTGLINIYRDRLHFTEVGQLICCAGGAQKTTCCEKGDLDPDSLQVLLRQNIVADSTGEFSRQGGREYIAYAQAYALLYPNRTAAPAYLNEAAKLALSMRMPSKGIELYQWIYTHFPDSEAAPKARFLEAFTYENELKDLESAKAAYEAYLEQFPNDAFARDARILLDNLGVDPEEMIRRFQNQ